MWGERGTTRSTSTLDSHIFRLRRVLEPDRPRGAPAAVLLHQGGGFRLAVDAESCDSTLFTRLATTAADELAAGDSDAARRHAEQAATLWRGRPYGAAADHDWARPAVAALEETRARLRETHIGALLGAGLPDRALAELDAALAAEPLRERLWLHRMTALRDTGRRAEALRAYADARTVLVEELAVEPGAQLQALHARLLRDDPPPAPRPEPTVRTLPNPRGPLIGRDHELAELPALIGPGRAVTLVGAAGCGKTRLAVQLARRVAHRFPHGAWFVDLTAAAPGRVADLVASALELSEPGPGGPAEALRGFTASRRLLVVLDNCEHVLDDVAALVEQLLDGGGPAILATSREPLEIGGEQVAPLAPLAVPDAVELLLARLPPELHDDDAAGSLQEIAVAVDGLPLALELAAARARAYTLTEIAAQVRADASTLSRIGRDVGARHHRTVRDAIDTSYRDLPAPLARLHRALAAVPGPFTAGLAAALAGTPDAAGTDAATTDAATTDAADAVAGLVHRSLLTALGPAGDGRPSRFAQLSTVRGHAYNRAVQQGEDPQVARDAWVDDLVAGRPRLGSARQSAWYAALDDDVAALRATLQHTVVDAPTAAGVALTGRLDLYWAFGGMALEGIRWADAAARACAADPGLGTPTDRAVLHLARGCSRLVQGRLRPGADLVRAALAEIGRSGLTGARVCESLAVATGPLRRSGDAALLAEVADAARRTAGADPALDIPARHAALVAAVVADPAPELVQRLATLHDEARAADNLYTAWSAAAGAAQILLDDGHAAEAVGWAHAAVRASVAAGLRHNAFALELYGIALGRAGEHAEALRALGAAETQHRGAGVPWPRPGALADVLTALTVHVGADAAERGRADGARTPLAHFLD
jgi:predicted ATPase/DNA-binding SARP family transcriptional activator